MALVRPKPQLIQNTYLVLTLFNTLAASFIWGINTLFLLDAGLSNAQAFLANAFFTVGQVIFEIPTGMVADMRGRRMSYLLGTITLSLSTLAYLGAWVYHAPFWVWAVTSMLLGLGFTFFSGATEAWLVDALAYSKHKGDLEGVFAKSQSVAGISMLVGSVSGGIIAQFTNLGVPYILRAGFLIANFFVALIFMHDWGFTAEKRTNWRADTRRLFNTSVDVGLKKPAIRWIMLGAPFASGVGFYIFYAMQPHLLDLFGDPNAYSIAGLAAALLAGSQIIGSFLAPVVKRLFKFRTSALLVGEVLGIAGLFVFGVIKDFWSAILFLGLWAMLVAALQPVRQAYLNSLIPSKQRATVLSFDSLLGSTGGVVIQPILGRVADIYSYGQSFIAGGLIQALSIPLAVLARREQVKAEAKPQRKKK
jgi:MFS family permease